MSTTRENIIHCVSSLEKKAPAAKFNFRYGTEVETSPDYNALVEGARRGKEHGIINPQLYMYCKVFRRPETIR